MNIKIILHHKHRGHYFGCKSGSEGEYWCSQKCNSDSNASIGWLCPYNESGYCKDKPIVPSILGPETISKLLQSDFCQKGCDGSSEMKMLIVGNVWIIL